ncbi:MarR family winged helix-turn-helix transcriptional regulator [Arcticibacter sp. MXS-1]|uniref:MarR family winged helix-turn-helix transcriptional regulator n=1 Tax=Arcticibacter sp. MXS-1 TaxID=3341726 RepID=UPI0035A99F61
MKQEDLNIEEIQKKNLFRIVYMLKRALEDWGNERLKDVANPEFHLSYIPFFMHIGMQGASNNALAAKFNVTKQAASRIVKGLVASGLVRAEKSDKDARLSMLYLTREGERFYRKMLRRSDELNMMHIAKIGKDRYNEAIEVLLTLLEIHGADKKPQL